MLGVILFVSITYRRASAGLEHALVYCGVQVGLAGPIGLLRQHELRDFAQRLPECHDYLRHGRAPWRDAWWQLNCELVLDSPPVVRIEPRIALDRFYLFLERTWMQYKCIPPHRVALQCVQQARHWMGLSAWTVQKSNAPMCASIAGIDRIFPLPISPH